jgi:hypothetical protein
VQQPLGPRDLIATLVIPFVSNFDGQQLRDAIKDVTDADCEVFGDNSGPNSVRFRSATKAPDGTHTWEFTRVNPGEFDPFQGMNRSGVAYWRFESVPAQGNVRFPK